MKERKDILYGTIVVIDKKKERIIENAVFISGDLKYKGLDIVKIVTFKNVGKTSVIINSKL